MASLAAKKQLRALMRRWRGGEGTKEVVLQIHKDISFYHLQRRNSGICPSKVVDRGFFLLMDNSRPTHHREVMKYSVQRSVVCQ